MTSISFCDFAGVKTSGMDFDRIMPSVSRLGEGNRAAKRQGVITRVMRVFEKYSGAAQKVIEYNQKKCGRFCSCLSTRQRKDAG